jgi:multidrug efflux system outer membrane protein
MMFKHSISIVCAGLALTGCTMIPKYERPAAPVAAQYPGATGTNAAPVAADIAWREVFADERLKQLIELALANNRDLRVAVLNVEQSRAQYRITRAASFPTVDGGASYTRSHASGLTVDQWSASLGTTAYELDFFGRVRSLNKQALEKYFATEEAQRSAQISLVAEVADEYFTLRQAEEQLQLARQTLGTVQESYTLNKATFDAGASSELDLRTAEGQVQTARINVLSYERRIAQAQNALVLLVGRPLPADMPAPRSFNDTNLVTDVPAGLPSNLVQHRPDILEAEHTLKAANANIGAARAAFFPTITFTGSMGTSSSQLAQLFGSGTGVWSFSPQVTVPIFTGGQNLADLDSAKAGTRIEVANYEKAIQTAFREVADALVATSSYANEIEAQAGLINAQQKRFELANLRYRQGEDSYLNVLSAQQDLYSAQQGHLEAQYNKLASQISLYKALGGGWK